MSTLPFVGLTEAGICARIIYQLVLIDWRRNPDRYAYPARGMEQLARDLRWLDNTVFRTALAAAIEHIAGGRGKLEQWRDAVVLRNRYTVACYRIGKPWGVSGAPPVSNTGGTEGALADIEAVRIGRRKSKRARKKANGY